jgi:signal transduction histidine kinase/ligand-binding sensor domain-containing protein/DNA-binding response OmpR family regulator
MKNKLVFLIIFWGLLHADHGMAQVSREFRFEQITVDDGLAHSDAMAVVQDHEGFMWVGTNKGINRYDGYELKKYDLPTDHFRGLSGNRIRVLCVDKSGRLWAGTESTGLFFYDKYKDAFLRINDFVVSASYKPLLRLLNQTSVRSVFADRSGRIWVGTQEYGVFMMDVRNREINHISQVELGTQQQTSFTAASVWVDGKGKVWIGTGGNGLWVVDQPIRKADKAVIRAGKVTQITAADIRVVYEDAEGNLWAGSEDKIFWSARNRPPGSGQVVFQTLPHTFHSVQCLYMDSFRRLWIGTNFGLFKLENTTGYLKTGGQPDLKLFLPVNGDIHSINSGRVHQIVEDSFNNLWLAASSGGLNKLYLRAKQFGHLHRTLAGNTVLPNNYVNAVSKDEVNNRLYIGTRNGFSGYDLATKKYRNYLHRLSQGDIAGADVSSFLITDKKVWIGTRYHGIYTLEKNNPGVPAQYPNLSGHKAWNHISVEGMTEDRLQNVWIGTYDGLMHFGPDGRHLKTYHRGNSALPSNLFAFLLYDKEEDVIWASTTDAGVLKLKYAGGKLHVLNHFKHEANNPSSLKVNFAWPLLKDRKGRIWIGTIGGGLHAVIKKDGKETIARYDQWITESDIESILDDEDGNLWIGGAGMFKFSPESRKLLHYDVSDGLQSNSFKVGSSFKSADGTMYFGGTNGINFFKPQDILSNPSPPVVRITRMRVLNKNAYKSSGETGNAIVSKPFSDPEGVVIKASENDFSFEFVGLNYVNPQKQQYAYYLEGYSQDWVQLPAGQRVASFANLPSGQYTFKVKANNGEGVWSVEPASVVVEILPPWYKTWWAYLIYTLLVSGILWWYRRITLSRIALKNRVVMKQMQVEKEKEIAEMKINFFTNVSHEFRTPLTLILGPMEEFMASIGESDRMKQKVVMMHKQTRKLLDLINQLLSFRKMEAGHVSMAASRRGMVGFLKEIFLIFKAKADERNLDYSLNVPYRDVMMYFDADKMDVILTNLLSNAFKYTPDGGKIILTALTHGSEEMDAVWENGKLTDNFLEISIVDRGYGIRPEELERIFDPYYQASNAGNSAFKGSGIGLALVKQMVLSHSGEVEVQSVLEKGTTFTVKLPFGRKHLAAPDIREDSPEPYYEAADEENTVVISAAESVIRQKTLKMLIVEDNAELRTYLMALFESEYEVYESEDGMEGWDKLIDLQPDLVLSDVMMPGMNGLELCKKVKQHPKTSHIPVILLTARAAAVQELEGLETGADDYIAKPFNPKILLARVASILQSRNKLLEYYQRRILLEPTEIKIPDEDRLLLENAMRTVEANLTNTDFNVQALVSAMGMSQSVFYRRIKNITGQSVIEFIKDIRLKRAAQLLVNEHARVSEIALMVGIEDPKNFRVSFQKLYNMSPSQYAKMHREADTSELAASE